MATKRVSWLRLPVISALVLILIILLVHKFGNFRQERVVKNFIHELQVGNFQKAYEIWGPSESYTYKEFLKDWGGSSSYYGQIRGYHIIDSKTHGNGVIVYVEFDHLRDPVAFWIDLKNLTMAFSPFNDLKK